MNNDEHRATRVMDVGRMLQEGWTPSELLKAGWGEGDYWRAIHLQGLLPRRAARRHREGVNI